jgi:lipoyl(octanoyl) transferase
MQLIAEYHGRQPYEYGLSLMDTKIIEAVNHKKIFLLGLEHDEIFTAGVKTKNEDILDKSVKPFRIRRGGSINLHNPGQLVIYLVAPLSSFKKGLESFIRHLEATIIETCFLFDKESFVLPPHSGVFTKHGKIGFIGLGMKQEATYHGCAINLFNKLEPYQKIKNCGLDLPMSNLAQTKPVTSTIKMEDFFNQFKVLFNERIENIGPAAFRDKVSNILYKSVLPQTGFRLGHLYFHEGRFWEAHEAWEMVWHRYHIGDYRTFLQGLIQLAMAMYKIFEKPNLIGAKSLLNKSYEKLNNSRFTSIYFVNAHTLLSEMANKINTLEKVANGDLNQDKSLYNPISISISFDSERIYK